MEGNINRYRAKGGREGGLPTPSRLNPQVYNSIPQFLILNWVISMVNQVLSINPPYPRLIILNGELCLYESNQ